MAQQVKGKTAIVTGAGSGINLEFTRLLLEHGANVVFADIVLRPEAEILIDKYQSTPNKAIFQRTDVSSWPDLDRLFEAATLHFGSIDIVCPGAGVFEPPWTGGRYTLLDINVTHPIRVTQMAISHFLAASPPASTSNPKSIVHIASIASQGASLPWPLYHASKHAIDGFVRCLANLEGLHGIRVTCVEPGVVKTPLWTEDPNKLKIVNEERDDWVSPQEVAEVMLALVTENKISAVLGGGSSEMLSIKGGTVLEVLAGTVRDVPTFNNVGPFATGNKGASISDAHQLFEDVVEVLKPGWGQVSKHR